MNASCNCLNGMEWNGSACVCPTGTNNGWSGVVWTEGSVCKCPANTTPDGEGGAAYNGPCKCPAGMRWVEGGGWNGGRCECDLENRTTQYSSKLYGNSLTSGNTTYGHRIGIGCCPEGTRGYVYDTGSTQNTGYTGATAAGGRDVPYSYARSDCFCPTNTGPKDSSSYQGTVVNANCACPTGKTWYPAQNGYAAGCYQCPPGDTYVAAADVCCPAGTTWDATCEQCLCNAKDSYGYTYGVYSQTNGCAQKQYNVPGGYFSTMTCRGGCTLEAHYYDAGMNCCYCSAQAGMNHDSEHDARGCYIGSN